MNKIIFIKNNVDELFKDLDNCTKNTSIIIYRNFDTELQVGTQNISNPLLDSLIIIDDNIYAITKNAIIETKDLIKYFERNDILYNEIYFNTKEQTSEKEQDELVDKDIWFVNDETSLNEAVADSKYIDSTQKSVYFDKLPGYFDIGYLSTKEEEKISLFNYQFIGVISTNDKLIILLNNNLNKIIRNMFEENNMSLTICNQGQPQTRKKKKKIKSLQ